MGADVTPFSHIVARRRRGQGKGVCPLASHFLYIRMYMHTMCPSIQYLSNVVDGMEPAV